MSLALAALLATLTNQTPASTYVHTELVYVGPADPCSVTDEFEIHAPNAGAAVYVACNFWAWPPVLGMSIARVYPSLSGVFYATAHNPSTYQSPGDFYWVSCLYAY